MLPVDGGNVPGKREKTMRKTMTILLLIALCAALCGCSVNMYSYDHAERYTAGDAAVTGRVEALDISWIDGRVNVGRHAGEGVLLSETCSRSLKADTQLHWWLDGGTLYVKYAGAGFHTGRSLDKELTVLLPEGLLLEEMVISAVSAEVQAQGVQAEQLVLNTVSGEMQVAADAAERVEAATVSGNVTLRLNAVPQRINAVSVSGGVTIALPRDAGVTMEVDAVSGTVGGTLPVERADGGRYISGDGKCSITVDVVSGNVTLDKLD